MSVIVAFVAVEGPTLLTTTVYVTAVPGTAFVKPSVFVIERSPCGVTLSVSVAELLAVFVSVVPEAATTVAVFTSVLVPTGVDGFNVAVIVYVAVVPEGNVTVDEMFPIPLAAPHVAPAPAATHVHVAPVSALGNESATGESVALDGPAFETTNV